MANSALQPSDTHTPRWSYPQVLPSRHGASPVERRRTTPLDVSAAHVDRSPGFDAQAIGGGVGCCGSAVVVDAAAGGEAEVGDCAWAGRGAPVTSVTQRTDAASIPLVRHKAFRQRGMPACRAVRVPPDVRPRIGGNAQGFIAT